MLKTILAIFWKTRFVQTDFSGKDADCGNSQCKEKTGLCQ